MTVREERSFRGINTRMAIGYLERLGGEQVDERTVEAEHWRAECSEHTVEIGPTLTLTEVDLVFEGDAAALEELLPKFRQKAMRAGG